MADKAKTALDFDMEQYRERDLAARVRWFFAEYAEKLEPETRTRFEADLFMLIRETHADANRQFNLLAANVNQLCERALLLNKIIVHPNPESNHG